MKCVSDPPTFYRFRFIYCSHEMNTVISQKNTPRRRMQVNIGYHFPF